MDNLYEKLVKDIGKTKSEKLAEILESIKEDFDTAEQVLHCSLTNEDLLIFITKKYENLDEEYSEENNKSVKKHLENYFNLLDKDIDDYLGMTQLSTGNSIHNLDKVEQQEIIKKRPTNTVANIIKGIAWATMILGFAVGLMVCQKDVTILLTIWFGSAITTVFTYAIAEVIQILHDIRIELIRNRNK